MEMLSKNMFILVESSRMRLKQKISLIQRPKKGFNFRKLTKGCHKFTFDAQNFSHGSAFYFIGSHSFKVLRKVVSLQ